MKLTLVIALCAVGLASSRIPNSNWLEEVLPESRIFEESVFRSGKEYRFLYNGQLLTGIPSSSAQHSGTRIQGLATIIFKTETTAIFKFTHIRMGKLNRRLSNPRAILPFMAFHETPISPELKAKLEAPVKFTYNKGLISNIVFDGIEQPWSANIKRGVLNLLQVNLAKENRVDITSEAVSFNEVQSDVTPFMDFFRVMENTLEGECETLYTVVREPHPFFSSGPVMNITKTINFERCQKRPAVRYNFRFQDPCPTCNSKFSSEEKFLKSSSVFKFNISGTPEAFLIERSNVESQYILVPFNEQGNVVVTYVNQTLVLFKSGPIETRVPEPQNPQSSDSQMVHTPDWDIMKEEFFMEGDDNFRRHSPYSEIPNKVEFVTSIFRSLISSIRESVQDPAPRYFDNLVKVFRYLKRQEIEKIWIKFYVEVPPNFTPEEHKKIKSILIDAIAFAGTKDSVFFLVQKIKSRQIQPFFASLALKSFVNIRTVSKEMIEELLTLAGSDMVRRNFYLKQSLYLTVGSMMNALCSPNEDFLAMEFKLQNPQRTFCPRALKQQYVEMLFEKFASSQKWEEKVLFMKAISNAGLDLSVFRLEKIIKNFEAQHPTFLRVEAVLALRQIKDFMPRKVQKVLMPIFMNRFEPPELRIVSAYQIFQTLPERPILDQIAKRLFTEPSHQVLSFVYTYMRTMANSTIPCEKKLAEDMQLALRHSRFPPFAFFLGYSKSIHKSFFSRQFNLGFDFNFQSVFSNTSYFPKYFGLDFNPAFGGFWSKRFFTFGAFSEGFENIFWKYFGERGFFMEKPFEEVLSRSRRSIKQYSPASELKSVFESLRIRPREYFPKTPRTLFNMKFKDQEFGFLPFSFEDLPEDVLRMVESGQFNIRAMEQFLESGYHFQFYKAFLIHEMSYKIPTTLGLPLHFSASVPTVTSFTGQIRAEFTPESRLQNVKFFFQDVKPSFVSTWFSKVEIWSPVVNTGLKVIVKTKFFYPFSGKIEFDMQKSPMEFLFSFQPPSRPVTVLTFETRPVTFTLVWPEQLRMWKHPEEITVMGEDWNRVKEFNKNYGEYLFGINFNFRGHWHQSPFMKQVDTPFCPLSGPNKFVFSIQPGFEMPKEVFFKFSGKFFVPLTEEFKPELREFQPFEESFEPLDLDSMKSFTPLEPTQHNFKFEIFTKEHSTPRRFLFDSFMKCGKFFRYCKFFARAERTPLPKFESQPFKFCFDAETLFPETPFRFNELVGKKAVGHFKLAWGSSCSSDRFIRLNVIGERSENQVQFERMSPEFNFFSEYPEDKTINGPVFQYEHILKHADLLQYKFDLEYHHLPVAFKNFTHQFYRYFKHYYYWQSDIAKFQVRNPSNKIRAFLTVDPFSRSYFNFTVKEPFENATFKDIPVPAPFSVIAPVNLRQSKPLFSLFNNIRAVTPFSSLPTCHVSNRFIKTFDSVKYTVPFSTCWTVLVKDCGNLEDPNFGVFMKKFSPESELKKIKIVTPFHRFFLVPENDNFDSVRIEFNGRQFAAEEFQPVMDHGHVVARAEKLGQYIMFHLPEAGIKIFFDGYSVNIKLSHFYRNIQCGLCGHFDYEPLDEFRLASNELTDDVGEFYRSFILQEDSCAVPELSSIHSSPRPELFQSVESLSPIMHTKVLEQNHQFCFSKEPIPVCPHNSFPQSYQPEKRVVYSCLNRDEPQAELFFRRAFNNLMVLPEISEWPASFTEMELFPETCSPLF